MTGLLARPAGAEALPVPLSSRYSLPVSSHLHSSRIIPSQLPAMLWTARSNSSHS